MKSPRTPSELQALSTPREPARTPEMICGPVASTPSRDRMLTPSWRAHPNAGCFPQGPQPSSSMPHHPSKTTDTLSARTSPELLGRLPWLQIQPWMSEKQSLCPQQGGEGLQWPSLTANKLHPLFLSHAAFPWCHFH